MTRRRIREATTGVVAVSALLLGLLAPAVGAGAAPGGAGERVPANVIVLSGDGMGYNQVDAASMYQRGTSRYQVESTEDGSVDTLDGPASQVYQQFPHQYAMATYPAGGDYHPQVAWTDFNYAAVGPQDSGSTGTAMASGVSTYPNAVGVDIAGDPVLTVTEVAQQRGMATGVVILDAISRAPDAASWVVHNRSRHNTHEIAEDMVLDSELDVILSGGHPYYDNDGNERDEPDYSWIPEDLFHEIRSGETGYDYIEERGDFLALTDGDTPKRVIGIAQVFRNQALRSGSMDAEPYDVPRNDSLPSLPEMTFAALNTLDNASDDGLFALIQSRGMNIAGHRDTLSRSIEEQIEFNDAVEAAVAWVEENSSWDETLMIVAPTHEAGYLTGPDSHPEWRPMVSNGPGQSPDAMYYSRLHTNLLVPLYAKGVGAQRLGEAVAGHDPVRGEYVVNTAVASVPFGPLR